MSFAAIDASTCAICRTSDRNGRTRGVAPESTASRHLHYGWIILDAGRDEVTWR